MRYIIAPFLSLSLSLYCIETNTWAFCLAWMWHCTLFLFLFYTHGHRLKRVSTVTRRYIKKGSHIKSEIILSSSSTSRAVHSHHYLANVCYYRERVYNAGYNRSAVIDSVTRKKGTPRRVSLTTTHICLYICVKLASYFIGLTRARCHHYYAYTVLNTVRRAWLALNNEKEILFLFYFPGEYLNHL